MKDLFHGIEVGRAIPCKSMVGTDFARFPDFIEGEVRNAFFPREWFGAATTADAKHMELTSRGWLYWTTRAQLAADIADTLAQLDTGYGSVREKRVAILKRLVTADEWQEAEDVYNAHKPRA